MTSLNKVMLIGNLTRDPVVRATNRSSVGEIGLAVSRSWFDKQSNSRKEEVTFVDVTLWGKDAENAETYLRKGSSVFIEGRLQLDTWDDKETGQKRSKMRVVCESIQYLSRPPKSEGSQSKPSTRSPEQGSKRNQQSSQQSEEPQGIPDDEIPF